MVKNILASEFRNSSKKVFFWDEDQLSKCILHLAEIKPKTQEKVRTKKNKQKNALVRTKPTISTTEMLFCMT